MPFRRGHRIDKRKKITLTCEQCGEDFEVHPYRIRRGSARFCSTGCGTRWRNLNDNPARRMDVRERISQNHADFSGPNNPMFGVRGESAPGYIDGRHHFADAPYRGKVLANREHQCERCGRRPKLLRNLHVHHRDGDRSNNERSNLELLCRWCHLRHHDEERGRNPDGTFRAAS